MHAPMLLAALQIAKDLHLQHMLWPLVLLVCPTAVITASRNAPDHAGLPMPLGCITWLPYFETTTVVQVCAVVHMPLSNVVNGIAAVYRGCLVVAQ